MHKPPVIVLDEPTAGVDVELRQTLWQFIAKLNSEGHTVLLTTHYLEEAEALCSRIAMLKGGEVVALNTTSELLKSSTSNVLRFKLDGKLPPELEVLSRITGRIVQLPAHDAQEIEGYLATLRQAGLKPEDIEQKHERLESTFLQRNFALLEGEFSNDRRSRVERRAVPLDLWPCAGGPRAGLWSTQVHVLFIAWTHHDEFASKCVCQQFIVHGAKQDHGQLGVHFVVALGSLELVQCLCLVRHGQRTGGGLGRVARDVVFCPSELCVSTLDLGVCASWSGHVGNAWIDRGTLGREI